MYLIMPEDPVLIVLEDGIIWLWWVVLPHVVDLGGMVWSWEPGVSFALVCPYGVSSPVLL